MLSPSSRVPLVLSLVLLPIMVLSGGCFFVPLLWRVPQPDCCTIVVADDPSYGQPPDAAFWKWLPRVNRRDQQTGQIVLEGRSSEIDVAVLTGDLRGYRARHSGAAAAYFSSLGMSCKPVGSDTRCEHEIDAWFVCIHTKPQPADYTTRHEGRLRFVVNLTDSDVVKSAVAFSRPRGSGPLCPFKPSPG